jgi:hypothetical protein
MLHFWRAIKLPDLFPNLLSPVTIITRGTTSRRASAADQPLLPAGQAPSRTLPEPPRAAPNLPSRALPEPPPGPPPANLCCWLAGAVPHPRRAAPHPNRVAPNLLSRALPALPRTAPVCRSGLSLPLHRAPASGGGGGLRRRWGPTHRTRWRRAQCWGGRRAAHVAGGVES